MRRAAAAAVALLTLTVAAVGCSSGSHSHADPISGITCSGDRFSGMSVDSTGGSGADSPLVAVATFLATAGSRLPHDGYQVDDTFVTQEGGGPSSVVDPHAGPTVPHETKTVVHRSSRGIDVAVMATNYGSGWTVEQVTFCPEVESG